MAISTLHFDAFSSILYHSLSQSHNLSDKNQATVEKATVHFGCFDKRGLVTSSWADPKYTAIVLKYWRQIRHVLARTQIFVLSWLVKALFQGAPHIRVFYIILSQPDFNICVRLIIRLWGNLLHIQLRHIQEPSWLLFTWLLFTEITDCIYWKNCKRMVCESLFREDYKGFLCRQLFPYMVLMNILNGSLHFKQFCF